MSINFFEKYFFFLFSIIPISIIAGPSISLINIVIINISFLVYFFIKEDLKILKNSTVRILFILYLYLIFNSFISLEFSLGFNRNFGFIRFIVLFIATNYFFYKFQNFYKIFFIWLIVFTIFCFDVYLESFSGSNILGYGKEYGRRIVSFFKDEPIAGAYINSFFLLILGFISQRHLIRSEKNNIFILILSILFFFAIVLTGERSNTIKAFLGLLIFHFYNFNINIKQKFLIFLSIIFLFTILFLSSDFIKYRFFSQIYKNINSKEKISKYYEQNIYFNIYRSGFDVFKNYPIFGVGNKNYRYETCNLKNSMKYSACTTHPHQIYFEFMSEHGIVGTIILLYIFFLLIFKILKKIIISKNFLQLGCFSYLFMVFVPILPGGSFFNDFNSTFFWINLSIMYASSDQTNVFSKKIA